MTIPHPTNHRLTPGRTFNRRWIVALVAVLAGVLCQGCALVDPPEHATSLPRDEVVERLVNAWAPNGWAIVNDNRYSVTFERMPDAGEAMQVGNEPLRIVVTITEGVVRARCSVGSRDYSRGRWAQRVQRDLERLLP